MTNKFYFTFCIFLLSSQLIFGISQQDSVGVENRNNKKFIIHEVETGETIFAISRKYNVDVNSIFQANPGSETSIHVGDRILVPSNSPASTQTVPSSGDYHIVKPSETLFSISKLYNISIDDLKSWNHLADNNISIGDKLIIKKGVKNPDSDNHTTTSNINTTGKKVHIVEQSQTLYSISRMYNVTANDLRKWNNLTSNNLDIGQKLIVAAPETSDAGINNNTTQQTPVIKNPENNTYSNQTSTNNNVSTSENIDEPIDKVTEKGLAEVIEDATDTKKYLALHRKAPIGTIMQVKNEMNNQSVFVRIVGTIPNSGDNSKVILKISKKAFDRLGAVDSRFPVEISYIP